MSRVKYPRKREISKQIQTIIERSGIFDEDEGETYIECIPVGRRFKGLRNAAYVLAGAAVLIAVLALIKPFVDASRITKSHAYGMTQDQKEPEDNGYALITSGFQNEYQSSQKSVQLNIVQEEPKKWTLRDGKIAVSLNLNRVQIAPDGKAEALRTCFDEKYPQIQAEIMTYLKQKYESEGSRYEPAEGSIAVVNVSLDVRCYDSVMNVLDNTLGLTYDYKESATINGKSEEETQTYYVNYDLETGKKLELENLFTDAGSAKSIIAQEIHSQVISMIYSGVYDSSSIANVYKSEEKIANQINSWSFTSTGDMIVYCNQWITKENAGAGAAIRTTKGQLIQISKESLRNLEKNAKYWVQ